MRMFVAAIVGLFAIGMMAMPHSYGHTETTSLDNGLVLEKITTTMSIPEDNSLPWGSVHGSVDSPAEGYPVIIQFYKGDVPVHFAQTDVDSDGSYDYRFRILNVVDGEKTNVFEGDYTVMIFKVVDYSINPTPDDLVVRA